MKRKTKFLQYYVEGSDEERLINVLKTDLKVIRPGKVSVFNAVQEKITALRLRELRQDTAVVLVFDVDAGNIDILNQNIKDLEKCSQITNVILIPQVPNIEGELTRCCNINNITELLGSTSSSHAKRDITHMTNLGAKLRNHKFDINLLWTKSPTGAFKDLANMASEIKLKK